MMSTVSPLLSLNNNGAGQYGIMVSMTSLTPPETAYECTQALFASMEKQEDMTTKRGKYFEEAFIPFVRLCPDFKTDIENVQRFETWSSSPGSQWEGSTRDLGIDFIITLKSGEKPIAIQTKYRSGNLTVGDIGGIALQTRSDGRNDLFSRVILVTNAESKDVTDYVARESIRTNIEILGHEWFVEIMEALREDGITSLPTTLEELHALVQNNNPKDLLKPFVLRPHQENIHRKVKNTLITKKADATTIHAACGTGKTLTAWSLMRDSEIVPEGGLCIIFTPALSLVDGIARSFKRQQTNEERYDIRAVCSDNSVNKDEEERDISTTQVHSSVFHDVASIKTWLEGDKVKGDNRRKVLISTYHSANIVQEAMEGSPSICHLIINDEAHRIAGSGNFGKPTWDIMTHKRVHLTATPRVTRLNKRTFDDKNVDITSMDDATKFGYKADWAVYPISKAVEDGILAPYIIEIIATPYANDINNEVRVNDKNEHARNVALVKICSEIKAHPEDIDSPLGSSIVFFNSIKESKNFVSLIKVQSKGIVPAAHVDGKMAVKKRLEEINKIRNEGGVLSNVRVLNEGVDIPSLNAIIFAESITSKTDIIQAMGRALRRDPNNPDKIARIIIPVASSAEEILDNELDSSHFSHVWQVLRAVCDHDDTMMRSFIEIRRKMGRGEKPRFPKSLRDNIRAGVSIDAMDVMASCWNDDFINTFLETILTKAVRSVVPNWYERYEQLVTFVSEHGTLPIRGTSEVPAEESLANWCTAQRQKHNKSIIIAGSPEYDLLMQIPGWKWGLRHNRSRLSWEDNYTRLLEFLSLHNSLPKYNVGNDDEENRLLAWCAAQRQKYKQSVIMMGKNPSKEQELLSKLPGWEWDLFTAAWNLKYEELLEFVNKHERLPIMESTDVTEKKLGRWCRLQRENYKRITNDDTSVSALNKELLSQIPGWRWSIHSEKWTEKYEETISFWRQHGHFPRTSSHDEKERKLGLWCAIQRTKYKHSVLGEGLPLSNEQELLSKMPGWEWQPLPEKWLNSYQGLVNFLYKRGYFPSDRSDDENERRLGNWCNRQRAEYKQSVVVEGMPLSREQELLSKVQGWEWLPLPKKWINNYKSIITFIEWSGRLPDQSSESKIEKVLGLWLSEQLQNLRTQGAEEQFNSEQKTLLNVIINWDNTDEV